jgi:hypothetical protein
MSTLLQRVNHLYHDHPVSEANLVVLDGGEHGETLITELSEATPDVRKLVHRARARSATRAYDDVETRTGSREVDETRVVHTDSVMMMTWKRQLIHLRHMSLWRNVREHCFRVMIRTIWSGCCHIYSHSGVEDSASTASTRTQNAKWW